LRGSCSPTCGRDLPGGDRGLRHERAAGNLGAGILTRFRVIFDYAHDCLWLEPRPGTDILPFERNRSGLLTDRREGALEVLFVAPGSPAEAAGWKTGERITAVDGMPVGPAYVSWWTVRVSGGRQHRPADAGGRDRAGTHPPPVLLTRGTGGGLLRAEPGLRDATTWGTATA